MNLDDIFDFGYKTGRTVATKLENKPNYTMDDVVDIVADVISNNINKLLGSHYSELQQEIKDTNQKLFSLIEKLYNIEQSKMDKITDSDRLNWLEQTYSDNEWLHEVPLNNLSLREFIDSKIK